jgi:hypothetical protein
VGAPTLTAIFIVSAMWQLVHRHEQKIVSHREVSSPNSENVQISLDVEKGLVDGLNCLFQKFIHRRLLVVVWKIMTENDDCISVRVLYGGKLTTQPVHTILHSIVEFGSS